jgi:hypothetical protein
MVPFEPPPIQSCHLAAGALKMLPDGVLKKNLSTQAFAINGLRRFTMVTFLFVR